MVEYLFIIDLRYHFSVDKEENIVQGIGKLCKIIYY